MKRLAVLLLCTLTASAPLGARLEPPHCQPFPPGGDSTMKNPPPLLAGVLSGHYSYGKSYGSLAGQAVRIKLTLNHNGPAFSGVMEEPYTNFGVPVDGKLIADVLGSIEEVDGVTRVRFTKEYRHFSQAILKYEGVLNPETGFITGKWHFPDMDESGTFRIGPK